jgi:hypothetical protein
MAIENLQKHMEFTTFNLKKKILAIDSQQNQSSKFLPSFLPLLSPFFFFFFNALFSLSCVLLRSGVLLLLCEAQQRFLYCSLLL